MKTKTRIKTAEGMKALLFCDREELNKAFRANLKTTEQAKDLIILMRRNGAPKIEIIGVRRKLKIIEAVGMQLAAFGADVVV